MKTKNIDIDIDVSEIDDEVTSLIPDLISSNTIRRKEARQNLEKLGPMKLEQLAFLLSSKNKQLRWEVAKALECGSTAGSIPIFLKLLTDDESDIRWIAAEGLINIGRASLIPLLHEIIYHESIYINEGAHHILQELLIRKEKRRFHKLLSSLKQNRHIKGLASTYAKEILDRFDENIV